MVCRLAAAGSAPLCWTRM